MRVSEGVVDEAWTGYRLLLADAAVTREVIETKRPAVVGSLRDPRLTPVVHEINKDFELKSWATLPLIVKDHVIGTVELVESGAERTLAAGRAGHGGRDRPRRRPRHRQRGALRARAADGARDPAAQRHGGADGRQPRPRRGREGGRRRAGWAHGVRGVRIAAARGIEGRQRDQLEGRPGKRCSASRSTTSSPGSSSASRAKACSSCDCRRTCRLSRGLP